MYITVAFAANILDFFVFFRPASGYYHPFANGCDYQAVAVCITCFFQHSVNVGSNRGFGHIQFCGNLGIGFSLAEQAQGLHLTVGQFAGKRIAEPHTRYTVRPEALTRKSAVNYAHKVAQSMGASPMQIIIKVMIPESIPSLISNATIAVTTILGYTAMSGALGGGGLGKIAINYGYYRYQYSVMILAVVFLILLVELFQTLGTHLAARCDKRIKHLGKNRKG